MQPLRAMVYSYDTYFGMTATAFFFVLLENETGNINMAFMHSRVSYATCFCLFPCAILHYLFLSSA